MKKRLITTSLLLLLNVPILLADDPGSPCGGSDPDATPCPIDSWVFILAAAVMIITTLHLHNKKTALNNLGL